jgi:hypothetical protein
MSGEIDMKMPSKKNNSTNAAMLAAVLALAACDRPNKPRIDTAPLPVMQVAAVDDVDSHLPTVVEQRHFAIYNTYRVLFDESANVIRPAGGVPEEGVLRPLGPMNGEVFSCSLHTAPLRD